ncbi:hypothetical protein [Chengkuizengella axinellae]|uniref:Spore coat protein n=1 Tax=Chengkuizengella axinellae TaxID=3064388 RepID=A0ABT9J3T9_9BACL|nr:hypothetical protein [Chengkuizengella sp. 2205SS18-9]MDP5275655.1 hypothetical protein [Chengkuizengella sp. 2205SS18-9]
MGVFDESKCECCVCPMQRVLKKIMEQTDQTVSIITTTNRSDDVTITDIKDFILFGTQSFEGGVIIDVYFPICNVSAVEFSPSLQLQLTPSKDNLKGECTCCEDPANKLLNRLSRSEMFSISYLDGLLNQATIVEVGEGIVIIFDAFSGNLQAISICQINEIGPATPI